MSSTATTAPPSITAVTEVASTSGPLANAASDTVPPKAITHNAMHLGEAAAIRGLLGAPVGM